MRWMLGGCKGLAQSLPARYGRTSLHVHAAAIARCKRCFASPGRTSPIVALALVDVGALDVTAVSLKGSPRRVLFRLHQRPLTVPSLRTRNHFRQANVPSIAAPTR